jgi:hypothetical protein
MTRITIIACVLLALAGIMQAQTANLTVTVAAEASLTVGNATLTTPGNFAPYTGTTNFTAFFRNTATGTGTLTMKVTTDFSTGSGPSVATSGTSGDTLTYNPSITGNGTTPAANGQVASTTASTSIATFSAGSKSAKVGDAGTLAWTMPDDPQYAPGAYTATVTYTISAN